LLDGYINQEDPTLTVDCSFFLVVYSLKIGTLKTWSLFKAARFRRRWVPEIPSTSYVFAGEIPWCETFYFNGETELTFTIGKRLRRYQVTR